jgi:hypothetical protein
MIAKLYTVKGWAPQSAKSLGWLLHSPGRIMAQIGVAPSLKDLAINHHDGHS